LTTLIVIIVSVVVIAALLIGVVAFCCYKKNQLDKESKGTEFVAVTKSRPVTPPLQSEAKEVLKNNGPAAQLHTDEENIGDRDEN